MWLISKNRPLFVKSNAYMPINQAIVHKYVIVCYTEVLVGLFLLKNLFLLLNDKPLQVFENTHIEL